MNFPLELISEIDGHREKFSRKITLNKGLTVLLGPNGSGKTHLLRGLKQSLTKYTNGKHVRFVSAGRMGLIEQYRSDYDGYRSGSPRYDDATYGRKTDAERRHQMETINGDFQTLAERADILIKIQERLRKLFKRDILIDWDGGDLKILFTRLDVEGKSYSSGREASGLMHLVGILAALYDDDVGALLLDEPEVSLHPQLQAFLLHEILSVAGYPSKGSNKKIVIIATHSTEMLQIQKPEDLLSLVFCYDLISDPVQISADAGELSNRKIQSLIARLGQEHKLSLFSKHPLLVEGPSDVLVLSAIANKLDMHLEAAGSQLLPVIGKGQMPTVAKLLRLLGKEPVALTDADAITDGLELISSYINNSHIAETSASEMGFSSANHMANVIYTDFCRLVDTRWDEISKIAESHPYWVNKKSEEELQAKRRSTFCTIFSVENSLLSTLANDNAWCSIKNRLTALLNMLELCGLFVLRKGAIESYYQSADTFTSIGKPSAAVTEIDHINNLSGNDIDVGYAELVRCIKYAARVETINESEALRDLLLSVVSPAHARFKDGERTGNYNMLARSILGERAKMFELNIEGEILIVSIKSNILNLKNFPLKLAKDDDVVKSINLALEVNV
ncbi:ATP-dependent endonuclease [Kluyvera ascorbata]|uniref:ATP-dependent endonuclease n=1 Tax=Kluyvera ascorbata TaxID=51288 RepID=UPI0034D79529